MKTLRIVASNFPLLPFAIERHRFFIIPIELHKLFIIPIEHRRFFVISNERRWFFIIPIEHHKVFNFMEKSKARYLITGGCGFIGLNLVRRLMETEDSFVLVYDALLTGSDYDEMRKLLDKRQGVELDDSFIESLRHAKSFDDLSKEEYFGEESVANPVEENSVSKSLGKESVTNPIKENSVSKSLGEESLTKDFGDGCVANPVGENSISKSLDKASITKSFGGASISKSLKEVSKDKRLCFVKGRLEDGELLLALMNAFDINRIVNLAAESHVDRSLNDEAGFFSSNVLGVHSLAMAAGARQRRMNQNHQAKPSDSFHHGLKMLHVSTDEVYGPLPSSTPATESFMFNPTSPYSGSKAAAECLLMGLRRHLGLNLVMTRSANNFGPCQHDEKLLPKCFKRFLMNEPMDIYGDGSHARDWLYVDDNADALLYLLENGESGEVYNVSNHELRGNLEMVCLVKAFVDVAKSSTNFDSITWNDIEARWGKLKLDSSSDFIRFVNKRIHDDSSYSMDTTKLDKLWPQRPKTNFQDAFLATMKWYWRNEMEGGKVGNHDRKPESLETKTLAYGDSSTCSSNQNKLEGVLLLGGNGTRLLPFTSVTNKHLLPVNGRFLMEYPLHLLLRLGCGRIICVLEKRWLDDFEKAVLGRMVEAGIDLEVVFQDGAKGIADALLKASPRIHGDKFLMMLGDNVLLPSTSDLADLKNSIDGLDADGAMLVLRKIGKRAEEMGNATVDSRSGEILKIVEKPSKDKATGLCVTGLYGYGRNVLEWLKELSPSARGELEISDFNNLLIAKGLKVKSVDVGDEKDWNAWFASNLRQMADIEAMEAVETINANHGMNSISNAIPSYWEDAGTMDSLDEASQATKILNACASRLGLEPWGHWEQSLSK